MDRSLRLYLTLKAVKYYQLVLIIQLVSGMLKQAKCCKSYKDMKIRYFPANSTMKEILLSQDQKITHAKSREIQNHIKVPN